MAASTRSRLASATRSIVHAGGTITSIAGTLQNIGGIETDGIDINFDLTTAETGIGQFRFQWLTSLLLSYDELFANPEGGFDRVDRKGFELGSPTRGFVETKSTLNTDWSVQDWSARLSLRYLSSLTEECGGLVPDFGDRLPRSARAVRRPTSSTASSTRTFRSAGRPQTVLRRQLDVHGRRQQPSRRGAADLLFVRPEQPGRNLVSHRGPVLVPESDLRELAAGARRRQSHRLDKAPARGPCFIGDS